MDRTQNKTMLPGMWPAFWDLTTQDLVYDNSFTLGALADSLYEYLPKMHALLGALDPVYEKMYKDAANAIKNNLFFRPMLPNAEDILFSGTMSCREQRGSLKFRGPTPSLLCWRYVRLGR